MRRLLLLALLLLLVSAPGAAAHGFRRPVEVRYSSYYYTPTFFYTPVYYPVVPTVLVPVPTILPAVPLAVPHAAPPSLGGEPPLVDPRPAPASESSTAGARTALRPGESFYTLLPGPAGMGRTDDRCSVAFWNLTGWALALRADGKDYSLLAGKSLTLDLPRSFAWQVVGREAEATRIAAGSASAEVLIRR